MSTSDLFQRTIISTTIQPIFHQRITANEAINVFCQTESILFYGDLRGVDEELKHGHIYRHPGSDL